MPSTDPSLPSSDIDVLIVGAGPAGYMAAAWLTKFKGLKVRIVEKRDNTIFTGQADGLCSRTLEVLQSFGFGDRALKEANHMIEVCFWNPDKDGRLVRTGRIPDTIPGISRFQQSTLHQGVIERFYRDHLQKHGPLNVEYGVMPESMVIDESQVDEPDDYPVTVVLRHLAKEEASPQQFGHGVQNGLFRSTNLVTEEEEDHPLKHPAVPESREAVRCKYVLGCDGAHSWVRRQLDIKMAGEQTDYVWGVLDIIPLTTFPDIRMRCAIHSASNGSVMVIPREKGLVRLYIQLADVHRDAKGYVDRSAITPETILRAAQKILAPYKIDCQHVDWFTVYQIGQRVASRFSAFERVFISGDACHTHSPKAGQGMNVSMMDQYNMGWKIGLVCKGILQRAVLKTYESERRKIAEELIAFDRKFARLFSGRPAKDVADDAGISVDEFQRAFETGNLFASGTAVVYGPSRIIVSTGLEGVSVDSSVTAKQELATGLPIGRRFKSFKVLNQADAQPWHIQDLLHSDGRWRLVIFAGDILDPEQKRRVYLLGEYLESPSCFISKYTPLGSLRDSLFQLFTVHSSPRINVELTDFPKALRPENDYSSVYVDDQSYHEGHGHAYENYGVDKKKGCMVIVRPDQYVSLVCDLEDTDMVERFLAGAFISQA